jgi:hypothetical protein
MSLPREPDFTLAAGPTTASARTLAALGSPITYHFDPRSGNPDGGLVLG